MKTTVQDRRPASAVATEAPPRPLDYGKPPTPAVRPPLPGRTGKDRHGRSPLRGWLERVTAALAWLTDGPQALLEPACPRCRSRHVFVSHAVSPCPLTGVSFGLIPYRCRLCDHRWSHWEPLSLLPG